LAAPVRITQIDPAADTAGLRACYQVHLACAESDDPAGPPWPWSPFRAWCELGWNGEPRQIWLSCDDGGEPTGYSLLELPDRDNTNRAYLVLSVRPERRRTGIGTALLRHCTAQARLAGRELLDGMTVADPTSAGSAFAASISATAGQLEIRRELRVEAGLPGRLRELKAEASPHTSGYSLVKLTGPGPESMSDQLARVVGAINDAPREHPGQEAAVWDADRIRAADRTLALSGERRYTVLARHDASGELAAITAVHVSPEQPAFGFQGLTAVTREHRGHRLGLAVKVALMEWMAEAEPQVERVTTFNAADNKHMIAINEALGFQVTGEFRSWEADVPGLDRNSE
jgi:RimJ/RimL family protein N-acetyltransferase